MKASFCQKRVRRDLHRPRPTDVELPKRPIDPSIPSTSSTGASHLVDVQSFQIDTAGSVLTPDTDKDIWSSRLRLIRKTKKPCIHMDRLPCVMVWTGLLAADIVLSDGSIFAGRPEEMRGVLVDLYVLDASLMTAENNRPRRDLHAVRRLGAEGIGCRGVQGRRIAKL